MLHRGSAIAIVAPQLWEPFLLGNESQTTFWRGIPTPPVLLNVKWQMNELLTLQLDV